MTSTQLTAAVLTLLAGSLVPSTASADTWHHIDRLALKLERQSRELRREFRHHFRHTCDYDHLSHDSRKLARLARHIHESVHYGRNLHDVKRDLREAKHLFRHLEEVVDRTIYRTRHGHVRHVRHLMYDIEDTLHHLRDAVRALTSRCHVRRVYHKPVHTGHKPHYSSGGIEFSRGGLSFRIGF